MNLEKYKENFESYLRKNLPKITPNELYAPYHYLMHLDGKRIRPILMMASHEVFRPMTEDVLVTSLVIELFHNFTLMHDDLMDRSDSRRGFPTVHKKYGDTSAILSGDAMLILSYQLLERLKSKNYFFELFSLYNWTALEICRGQQLDMNFEQEVFITEMAYLMMIEKKTAVLLGASMKIGAILAEASANDALSCYEFGLNIGLAFQLQDDLLDTFGDTALTGKVVGGDISNNKKTLLLIYAMQNAHKIQKELILNWIQTREFSMTKIEEVTQIFIDSGAKKYVENKRNYYHQKALDNLKKLRISGEQETLLISFANKAVQREK